MADDFNYDVFLRHSSQAKAVVRGVAERLRGDGLRVWFDEWEILKAEGGMMKDEFESHPSSLFLYSNWLPENCEPCWRLN